VYCITDSFFYINRYRPSVSTIHLNSSIQLNKGTAAVVPFTISMKEVSLHFCWNVLEYGN